MDNAIAPACPINNCPGEFVHKTSKRGRTYRQCDTCGTFDGARFLTKAERVRQKAEKAAKKAKKTVRQVERQTQLPLTGWTPGDWFPELREEQCQMRLNI